MPNIVLIMTDNQGAWTLGSHGNPDIRMPHLDGLARDGMRFTNAYCANAVCSPNRATVLTGLIPSQHGVHSYLGEEQPDAQIGPDAYCTIREFDTLPRILSEAGYTCGLCGKWHLGGSLHPAEGFSYWFALPKSHRAFYDAKAVWEGEIYIEPRYITDVVTDHALDFIAHHRDNPFFLYVPYPSPYRLGRSFLKPHRNRHTEYYADRDLPSFPRESVHHWLYLYRDLINNPVSIRSYAAALSGVDDGVGAILNALSGYGLEDNTLVVFTADHGLCGGHHGIWGMGDHSRPLNTFEEGIHIPLLFRHPGRIPAGRLFEGRTSHYDLFPSLLDYLGLAKRIPAMVPGTSYAPALSGASLEWDDAIFYEFENVRLIRTDRWKYTWRHPDGPDELYDMQSDVGERNNLAGSTALATTIRELRGRIESFFGSYVDPEYDLWRGGRSKAGRLRNL